MAQVRKRRLLHILISEPHTEVTAEIAPESGRSFWEYNWGVFVCLPLHETLQQLRKDQATQTKSGLVIHLQIGNDQKFRPQESISCTAA
jgi:hypothetical protein